MSAWQAMSHESSGFCFCFCGEVHGNEDPRTGTPDCDCGHSSFRHHGSDRSGRGYFVYSLTSEFTGCKDCGWCDYYKPRWNA